MGDFADHSAHGRGVFQLPRAANLVQAEADQRFLLARLALEAAVGARRGADVGQVEVAVDVAVAVCVAVAVGVGLMVAVGLAA